MRLPRVPGWAGILATLLAIVLIACVDFATGTELRVFPLYFLPLIVAAWQAGRTWTLTVALVCSGAWLLSNWLAGLRFSSTAVLIANFVTQTTAFVVVGYLLSGMRTALMRERDLSHTDELTSLSNRRKFLAEAARALGTCRRYERPISVAFVDVDDFKRINDVRGHQAGDEILRAIARVLERATRLGDCVARMGGDEFAILMPETGPAGARAFADRLRAELDDALAGGSVGATVSVGAVAFEHAPLDVESMLREADAVMYAVKNAGKNGLKVAVFGPIDAAAG